MYVSYENKCRRSGGCQHFVVTKTLQLLNQKLCLSVVGKRENMDVRSLPLMSSEEQEGSSPKSNDEEEAAFEDTKKEPETLIVAPPITLLPPELLLDLLIYLDADAYIRLSRCCSILRHFLRSQLDRWAFRLGRPGKASVLASQMARGFSGSTGLVGSAVVRQLEQMKGVGSWDGRDTKDVRIEVSTGLIEFMQSPCIQPGSSSDATNQQEAGGEEAAPVNGNNNNNNDETAISELVASVIYDSVVQILEDRGDGHERYHRMYRGLRSRHDRTLVGGMPLGIHPPTYPFNPSMGYYEIEVVSVEPNPYQTADLKMGVAREGYPSDHPVGSQPHSAAFYSREGSIALGHREGERFSFAPTWGKVGDVVGCGYILGPPISWSPPTTESPATSSPTSHPTPLIPNLDVGPLWPTRSPHPRPTLHPCTIFYTLNGHWVGDAPHTITTTTCYYRDAWHPAITASSPCTIRVNLGTDPSRPFKYARANQSEKSSTHMDQKRFLVHRPISPSTVHDQPLRIRFTPNTLPTEADPYPHPPPPTLHPPTLFFPDTGPTHPRSFLSTHPLSLTRPAYFELTVLSTNTSRTPHDAGILPYNAFISLGVATRPFSPFHHVGWDAYSVGYHSDDGKIYKGAFVRSDPAPTSTRSSPVDFGTVLGCGYNPLTGSLFFTRNGHSLGISATNVFAHELYFVIAATRSWKIGINTGDQPFVYEYIHPWIE
ncbi:hypothetical protein DFS34DRAFT_694762 [Phlyctochytrium arcticum]|nr:hypothetical protein DFS34DRAFT_694762 [Phlyctochytrium arcticum]